MRTLALWTSGVMFVLVLGVGAVGLALWNNLSSEWSKQAASAQYALNHTPLSHIDAGSVFSGPGGVEHVFFGTDVFHRPGVVFVENQPMRAILVPTRQVLGRTHALSIARRLVTHPLTASLGYLNATGQALMHTHARLVWEVTYNVGGQYRYLYLNAVTGQLVWWK